MVKSCYFFRIAWWQKARTLALASNDIQKKIIIFNTLGEAMHDIGFLITICAKIQNKKNKHYCCNELTNFIINKQTSVRQFALVFGREKRSLIHQEISYCNIIFYTRLKNKFSSRNLAQAIIIYIFSLTTLLFLPLNKSIRKPNESKYQKCKKTDLIMTQYQISNNQSIAKRIIERIAFLSNEGLNLQYSI